MAQRSGYIGRHPGDGNSAIVRQTYSLTSETTELSFTAGYIVGFLDVYLNGVKLIDVQDYEATNASTIGLTTAAPSGDVIEVVAYKALNVGNVTNANGNFTVAGNTTLSGTVSVASTATLSGVTTCEGDLYVGGDLYVLDDIVYDEVSGRNIYISGIATVGSATTIDGSGINVTGVITATSFSGDGSSLTGVAATDYVVSNTLKVVGISTFSGEVQVGTAVTIGTAGITTFSKGVHLDGTTVFGKGNAVMLENGFENENAQIVNDGATEKATIVFKTSSGGTVSERLRIKDTGDVDLSGSAAGVSSVTWDASANSLIFKDNSKSIFGDSSDFQIYHNGTSSYIDNNTSHVYIRSNVDGDDGGNIYIQAKSGEDSIVCNDDGNVQLYYDNVNTFQTNANGVKVQGPSGGSAILYLNADQGSDDTDKFRFKVEDDGPLKIENKGSGSWETSIEINGNGNVELYYDNAIKLATLSTGAAIVGVCSATSYTGDGSALTGVGGEFDITSCLFI